MAQLWDWTPRPTRTRLLHDVAAKPAVLSTPVNNQVLICTPKSREASLGEFLVQGNCDSVASTRNPHHGIQDSRMSSPTLYHLLHHPPPPHTHTHNYTQLYMDARSSEASRTRLHLLVKLIDRIHLQHMWRKDTSRVQANH